MTFPDWTTLDHPARWAEIRAAGDFVAAVEFQHAHQIWASFNGGMDAWQDPETGTYYEPGHREWNACANWISTQRNAALVAATLDPAIRPHVPAFDHFTEAGYLFACSTPAFCETAIAHVGGRHPDGVLADMDQRPVSVRSTDPNPGPGTRLRNLVDHREGFFAIHGPNDLRNQLETMRTDPKAWGTPAGISADHGGRYLGQHAITR